MRGWVLSERLETVLDEMGVFCELFLVDVNILGDEGLGEGFEQRRVVLLVGFISLRKAEERVWEMEDAEEALSAVAFELNGPAAWIFNFFAE